MKAHFIGHLVGFDFSGSPYLRGILHDTKQIRDRAFHYLFQFFSSAACEEGLVALILFLEDVHWADDGSLDAIDHLLQNGVDLPILVISISRPTLYERRPNWARDFERIDIAPLSEAESNQLVEEILKLAPDVPASLVEMIVSGAEGNPFYVEELIKVLIDEKAIIPGQDQWQVVPERLAGVRIPPTLTGILQTRLDGLPAPEREALQCAAVVGRVFWESAVAFLEQAPDLAGAPLVAVFQSLLRRELIFSRKVSTFSGTREYIFKHALLRDVAYDTVLKRQRRAYHERVASWLFEQSGERVNEYAGLIAEHYELAQDLTRAATWYQRAGEQALVTYAPETALGYLQKALAIASQAPAVDDLRARRINMHLMLADVLELLGRWDEAETHCQIALSAAQTTQLVVIAQGYQKLGQLSVLRGDYDAALAWLEKARAGYETCAEQAGMGQALTWAGNLYWRTGEYAAARLHLDQGLALAREVNDRPTMALALNNLGNVISEQGDNFAAMALYEESLAIKRELGDKRGVAGALNNLANVASDMGDNAAARVLYEECLSQLREIHDRRGMGMVISNLALVVQEQGDLLAALTLHEESLDLKRSMGDRPGIAIALNNLGIVALEQKQYAAALSYFVEGLALAHELGDKRTIIYDLVGLSGVVARVGALADPEADPQCAAQLVAAAESQLSQLGATLEPIVRRLFDNVRTQLQSQLTPETYALAWHAGQALTLEQILALVKERDAPLYE